jgi:hypothetical protein
VSGGTIIGTLLRETATVTARVPAGRIKTARLPEGEQLPAMLVRDVSLVERVTLRRQGWVRMQERVAVTVRAESNAEQKQLSALVLAACAGVTGKVAGFENVSVVNAGAGPAQDGPGNSYERTQDFRVAFDAPA